jgi:hypothetical protein
VGKQRKLFCAAMKYNLLNKRKNNKTTSLYHFSTFHTYINCSVFTVSCYYLLKKFTKFTVDPDYKADISSNIQINGMARSDSTINQQSTDTMSVSTTTDKRTYTIQQQNHSETDEYKKNSNTTLADPHILNSTQSLLLFAPNVLAVCISVSLKAIPPIDNVAGRFGIVFWDYLKFSGISLTTAFYRIFQVTPMCSLEL